jgi:two-component system, NtrC family, sensor histidine kinase KinB
VTLRRRLLLAQAPLGAALLLVGAASLRTVSSLGESSENILKDNFRSVLAAQRMGGALDTLDRLAVRRSAGRPADASAEEARRTFEGELRAQEGNVTEPGEAEATVRLRAAWQAYLRAPRAAAPDGGTAASWVEEVQAASVSLRGVLDEILALNQDAIFRKSDLARRTAARHLQLMLGATLAALALGLAASVSLTARLVRPISALSRAVRRFGEATWRPGPGPEAATRSPPWAGSSTPWPTTWRPTAGARSATCSGRSREPRRPSTACRTRC